MKVNYHVFKESVVINFDGKTFSYLKNLPIYTQVLELIRAGKKDEIPELISYEEKLKKIDPEKNFVFLDGKVYSLGVEVEPYIATRLVELHEMQLPLEPLLNFWRKAQLNPSENSRTALFKFVEFNKLPLTEEGNFIAYKCVNSNFKDFFTGKMSNKVGENVTMNRADVDPERKNTCSTGLHVASYDYAKFHYGGSDKIMLEVEIDPKDVVTVPPDYNQQKCRTCGYTVVGVCEGEIQDPLVDSSKLKEYGQSMVGKYIKEENTEEISGADTADVTPVSTDLVPPVTPAADPVKKRDNRSQVKEKEKSKKKGLIEIGRTAYTSLKIDKSGFTLELDKYKYKSICAYDQAMYFKTLNPLPIKVYRTKSSGFRYIIVQENEEKTVEYTLLIEGNN